MSPIDDELRAALHGRAATLTPAPDPLAGIEGRARGMRRRRVAVTMTGAALAAAAVGLAVPSIVNGQRGAPERPAATASAALPTNALQQSRNSLGSLDAGTLSGVVAVWAGRHAGGGPVYSLPLVQGTAGDGRLSYALLEVWRSGGPAYGVVAQDVTGDDPVLVRDEMMEPGAAFLDGVIAGNGAGPFVVYALALDVQRIAYDPGTGVIGQAATFQTGEDQANAGVYDRGSLQLGADRLVATYADGHTVTENVFTGPTDGSPADPDNLLTWPTRGAGESDLVAKVDAAYAPTLGTTADQVEHRILFAGNTDSAVHYVVGQVWKRGDATARSFAYAEGGTNGPQVFFGPVTPNAPKVLAFLIDSLPGTTTDLLVVVPAPRTSQVMYDDDATGAFRPVSDTPGTDGVALVDRSRTATADRLQLLTGNGDPATDTTFEGPVTSLLCGAKECG